MFADQHVEASCCKGRFFDGLDQTGRLVRTVVAVLLYESCDMQLNSTVAQAHTNFREFLPDDLQTAYRVSCSACFCGQ